MLSDTRWACHINSLRSLNTALAAVLDTLEEVAESESDSRIVAEANGLVNLVNAFEFILIFTVVLEVLGTTNALSQLLQQKKQDFFNATKLVKATTQTLQQYRSDDSWDSFWKRATAEAAKDQIDVPDGPPGRHRRIPRRIDAGSSEHRFTTSKEFYRVTFYFPVIDMLLQKMERRFNREALKAIDEITALDPSNQFEAYSEEKLLSFASNFPADIPNDQELTTELKLFMNYAVQGNFTSCNTVQDMYKSLVTNRLCDAFPLVSCLYKLALTLPVTTATNERTFSLLKIVKTRLRSTMSDPHLSNLCVLSFERELTSKLDSHAIVNVFATVKSRRMEL